MGISIIALLILIGLIALVVVLLTRLSWKGWLALAVACFVVVPAVAIVIAIMLPAFAKSDDLPDELKTPVEPFVVSLWPEPSGAQAETDLVPQQRQGLAVWDPNVERGFRADKYPSDRSAAAGLAHHLIRQWKAQTGLPAVADGDAEDAADRMQVKVCGAAPARVLAAIDRAVRLEWPEAVVEIAPDTSLESLPDASRDQRIFLEARILATSRSGGRTMTQSHAEMIEYKTEYEETGSLQVSLISDTGRRSAVAEWVDKPWLDDFAAYRSAFAPYGGGHDLEVAYSRGLAATPDEAQRQAMASAAELVWAELQKRMSRAMVPSATQVERQVQWTGAVKDMFVQRLQRPYGDVYRAAVLVNVSTDAIASQQTSTWLGMIGGLAGLVLLIVAVYLFLNAATKGYYTWALRGAGAVIIAAGVLIVLTWA